MRAVLDHRHKAGDLYTIVENNNAYARIPEKLFTVACRLRAKSLAAWVLMLKAEQAHSLIASKAASGAFLKCSTRATTAASSALAGTTLLTRPKVRAFCASASRVEYAR